MLRPFARHATRALAAVAAAACARKLAATAGEVAFLRGKLAEIVPGGVIRDEADLVAIKRYLTATIRYDRSRVDAPRPLLRNRASTTLTRGDGFCGENARAAVLLLNLGGVRANRLYLTGARWEHVVVEHAWKGGWCLFDGHNDPGTLLPDELVGKVDSSDLAAFPNRYEMNPWVGVSRLGVLRRVPGVRKLRWRPPRPVAVALELPTLIEAVAAAGAAAAFAAGSRAMMGR